jgi:hypothetical protein
MRKKHHFAKMSFVVLQYIFAMYFAFNWRQACSFMNKWLSTVKQSVKSMYKHEFCPRRTWCFFKSKFNRCLGYVLDLGKCYKHFSIKIPYRTCFVFSISFINLWNFYAILNSVSVNNFLCKLVFKWNCINVVINNVVYLWQLIQLIVFLCVFIYGRLHKL